MPQSALPLFPAAPDHSAHGAEGGWLSAASLLGALAATGVTAPPGERHEHYALCRAVVP